jgi:hypothetical protein
MACILTAAGRWKVQRHALKVRYDSSVNVLRILFSDAPIAESDEDKSGVILDAPAHE